MMKYPDYVIEKLNKEYKALDRSFSSIWSLMSSSEERDEIMLHIMMAKKGITKIITDHKEESQ